MNDHRKAEGERAFQLFLDSPESKTLSNEDIVFFSSPEVARGLLGITAGRISELAGVPAIVCHEDDDMVVGSIRGQVAMSLVDFLGYAKDLFLESGGHASAAGFRLKKENFQEFKARILQHASKLHEDAAIIDEGLLLMLKSLCAFLTMSFIRRFH